MASITSTLEEKTPIAASEARKKAALLACGLVPTLSCRRAKEYEAEIPEDETYE